jgi:hypothetical protein
LKAIKNGWDYGEATGFMANSFLQKSIATQTSDCENMFKYNKYKTIIYDVSFMVALAGKESVEAHQVELLRLERNGEDPIQHLKQFVM